MTAVADRGLKLTHDQARVVVAGQGIGGLASRTWIGGWASLRLGELERGPTDPGLVLKLRSIDSRRRPLCFAELNDG